MALLLQGTKGEAKWKGKNKKATTPRRIARQMVNTARQNVIYRTNAQNGHLWVFRLQLHLKS
jgi:hypothetical protein